MRLNWLPLFCFMLVQPNPICQPPDVGHVPNMNWLLNGMMLGRWQPLFANGTMIVNKHYLNTPRKIGCQFQPCNSPLHIFATIFPLYIHHILLLATTVHQPLRKRRRNNTSMVQLFGSTAAKVTVRHLLRSAAAQNAGRWSSCSRYKMPEVHG